MYGDTMMVILAFLKETLVYLPHLQLEFFVFLKKIFDSFTCSMKIINNENLDNKFSNTLLLFC